MYKDIITYQLANEVSEEQLLTICSQVLDTWMKNQPGFIKWEIHKDSTDRYTDIVYWRSKNDAEAAEKEMKNIPNADDWYACYKEGSISSKNLEMLRSFE